jgi:hypothetical protein
MSRIRTDYPDGSYSTVTVTGTGRTVESWYNAQGKAHREGAPSHINTVNGLVIKEHWGFEGLWHRPDGPCMILRSVHKGEIEERKFYGWMIACGDSWMSREEWILAGGCDDPVHTPPQHEF